MLLLCIIIVAVIVVLFAGILTYRSTFNNYVTEFLETYGRHYKSQVTFGKDDEGNDIPLVCDEEAPDIEVMSIPYRHKS